jgi:hypothetical protein
MNASGKWKNLNMNRASGKRQEVEGEGIKGKNTLLRIKVYGVSCEEVVTSAGV